MPVCISDLQRTIAVLQCRIVNPNRRIAFTLLHIAAQGPHFVALQRRVSVAFPRIAAYINLAPAPECRVAAPIYDVAALQEVTNAPLPDIAGVLRARSALQ